MVLSRARRARASVERLIESILDKPFLIYGAQVCQLCGKLKPFHGWAAAVWTHRGRDYICVDCLGSEGEERAWDELRDRRQRFCEICTRRVTVRQAGGDGLYRCNSCRRRTAEASSDRTVREYLDWLSRRRNLEHRSTEGLQALDHNSEVARLTQEAKRRERELLDEEARAILDTRHGRGRGS